MAKKRAISDKHLKLVDMYFKCNCNETEAARRAGYSSPNTYATRLFAREDVRAEIERRQELTKKRYKLDDDWVISRFMKLADANFGEIKRKLDESDGDLDALDADELYALAEMTDKTYTIGKGENKEVVKEFKIGIEKKIAALTALARKQGMFNDKLELVGGASLEERLQAGRNRVKHGENDDA